MKIVDDMPRLTAFLMGMGTFLILIILCGLTPKHQIEKDQREAVTHGHAQWVTKVDENGNPLLIFEWNKSCNK